MARRPQSLVLTEIDCFVGLNQRTHQLIRYLRQRYAGVTVLGVNSRVPVSAHHVAALAGEAVDPLDLHHTVLRDGNVSYLGMAYLTPRKALEDLGFNALSWYRTTLALYERYARTLLAGQRFQVAFAQGPKPGVVASRLRDLGIAERVVYEDLDDFAGFFHYEPELADEVARYEELAIRRSDAVVSVSEGLRRLRAGQAPSQRHLVIPNGVDYPAFAAVQGRPRTQPVLAYAGSLEDWAGLDTVLEALALLRDRLPEACLHVLGSGPAYADLTARVQAMGLAERVRFLGRVPYATLPQYLAQARAGVMSFKPSRLTELAFPLKMLDYMAAGLPVLGAAIGEVRRLVEDTRAGLVYRDAVELAEQAFRVLTDDGVFGTLAAAAVETAENYDWPALFDREMAGLARAWGLRSLPGRARAGRSATEPEGPAQPDPGVPEGPAGTLGRRQFTFGVSADAPAARLADAVAAYAAAFSPVEPVSLRVVARDASQAHHVHQRLEVDLRARGIDPDAIADVEITTAEAGAAAQCWLALDPPADTEHLRGCLDAGGSVCHVTGAPTLRSAYLSARLQSTGPWRRITACPACGTREFSAAGRRADGLAVLRCGGCGLMVSEAFPERPEALYGREYFRKPAGAPIPSGYTDYQAARDADFPWHRLFSRMVRRPPGRLLDVGSATGRFLQAAARQGWEVCGVDVSPWACEQARGAGLAVHCGTLDTAPYPAASFDVVTAFDVLEHVADPRTFLGAARRFLAPGGQFVMTTTDGGASRRLAEPDGWTGFTHSLEHLCYFDAESLGTLLAATFGVPARVEPLAWGEYDYLVATVTLPAGPAPDDGLEPPAPGLEVGKHVVAGARR